MSLCSTPSCETEVSARGMCAACYQFDMYHRTRKHGQFYFAKYQKKVKRLLSRANMRVPHRARQRRIA